MHSTDQTCTTSYNIQSGIACPCHPSSWHATACCECISYIHHRRCIPQSSAAQPAQTTSMQPRRGEDHGDPHLGPVMRSPCMPLSAVIASATYITAAHITATYLTTSAIQESSAAQRKRLLQSRNHFSPLPRHPLPLHAAACCACRCGIHHCQYAAQKLCQSRLHSNAISTMQPCYSHLFPVMRSPCKPLPASALPHTSLQYMTQKLCCTIIKYLPCSLVISHLHCHALPLHAAACLRVLLCRIHHRRCIPQSSAAQPAHTASMQFDVILTSFLSSCLPLLSIDSQSAHTPQ
jgi:hypothetical protein